MIVKFKVKLKNSGNYFLVIESSEFRYKVITSCCPDGHWLDSRFFEPPTHKKMAQDLLK
jgi:hypothetical protein